MKKIIIYVSIIAVAQLVACQQNGTETPKKDGTEELPAVRSKEESIKRGQYLVTVGGCNDCHSPKKMTDMGPVPDMDRMLSGHDSNIPLGPYDTVTANTGRWVIFNGFNTAFAGPWGMSFAANLTPDETGIGNWSLDNFKTALKKGKYKGIEASRPLLPPMPWPNYAQMTDEDIEAMYDYLMSIKPISNRVPNAVLAQR
ncbi:MAG: c-type cytochrome [Sphingobacteriales bacterium]|nr:MAG: c-type cytochrome [Sphingobacteriales bacterium]